MNIINRIRIYHASLATLAILAYRWLSGQPTSKALRTLFKLCGMKVTAITVYGSVAEHSAEASKRYGRYIDNVRQLGEGGK